jgi:hypothetical protein
MCHVSYVAFRLTRKENPMDELDKLIEEIDKFLADK